MTATEMFTDVGVEWKQYAHWRETVHTLRRRVPKKFAKPIAEGRSDFDYSCERIIKTTRHIDCKLAKRSAFQQRLQRESSVYRNPIGFRFNGGQPTPCRVAARIVEFIGCYHILVTKSFGGFLTIGCKQSRIRSTDYRSLVNIKRDDQL